MEIIGNSKNVGRLQKHFKKMFAGVAMLLLNEDSTVVTGLASKEGEEVIFHKPVSITEHPKINEWLMLVEKEMRNTLARLLAQSVQDCGSFLFGQIDEEKFMQWLDSYQVSVTCHNFVLLVVMYPLTLCFGRVAVSTDCTELSDSLE